MSARHRNLDTQCEPGKRHANCAAARLKQTIEEPDGSLTVGAKTEHLSRTGTYRRCREPRIMRTIAIQYGDARGFEPEKNFTLCIGDRLNRGKKAEMRGLDGGDYPNVRSRQSSEIGYFARMVHAQLENAISNIWRHPGE
jgi:hypothetical protein